ncbi:hypothetical protein PtB15_15B255 [Puccinia triticina]|nr:hypothetical protein PtB15_15B255 [Puccinia triticina]
MDTFPRQKSQMSKTALATGGELPNLQALGWQLEPEDTTERAHLGFQPFLKLRELA